MTTMPAQGHRTSTPKKVSIFKELYSPHSFLKAISFINRSFFLVGLVQQLDKIVARFALTIYPYSLAAAMIPEPGKFANEIGNKTNGKNFQHLYCRCPIH
jgi:hypothetical protein